MPTSRGRARESRRVSSFSRISFILISSAGHPRTSPGLASCNLISRRARLRSEHEKHRTQNTQSRPEKVELERLTHVKHCERDEHQQRDDLLHDLQLSE